MAIMIEDMVELKGNWKLTNSQYIFFNRLLTLYRQKEGRKFNKRLRGWLFFNQQTRLHAADFLAFLYLFDLCSDAMEERCNSQDCPDYQDCMEVFDIICDRSDYSPNKRVGGSGSYESEPPILHGKAMEFIRLLQRRYY